MSGAGAWPATDATAAFPDLELCGSATSSFVAATSPALRSRPRACPIRPRALSSERRGPRSVSRRRRASRRVGASVASAVNAASSFVVGGDRRSCPLVVLRDGLFCGLAHARQCAAPRGSSGPSVRCLLLAVCAVAALGGSAAALPPGVSLASCRLLVLLWPPVTRMALWAEFSGGAD